MGPIDYNRHEPGALDVNHVVGDAANPISLSSDGTLGRPPDGVQNTLSRLAQSEVERSGDNEPIPVSKTTRKEDANPIKSKGDFGGNVPLLAVQHDMNHGDRVSFQDMVLGQNKLLSEVSAITDMDVDIMDEDVRLTLMNGTSTVYLSKRLHAFIGSELSNFVVVTNRNPRKNNHSRDEILNNGDGRALRAAECHSKGMLPKDNAGKNSTLSEQKKGEEVASQEVVVGSKKSGKNGLISGAKGGHGQGASSSRTVHECTPAKVSNDLRVNVNVASKDVIVPKLTSLSVVQVVTRNDEPSRSVVKNVGMVGGGIDSTRVDIERWLSRIKEVARKSPYSPRKKQHERQKNNIPNMVDLGEWIMETSHNSKFYPSLFEALSGSLAPWLIANRFEAMTYDEACKLNGEITDNEVQKAIFDMSLLKSP
ncbi:hypothetical protein V6N12_068051 [Hibiscus sabdariffa]|uniref:Uncharacterized protein n=1 Tax=Hibiscus sabdariffa TaxID=183260 RepID=A0ABR2FPJ1_9ROSI